MSEQEEYSPLDHLKQQREDRIRRRNLVRLVSNTVFAMFIGTSALSVVFFFRYFISQDMADPLWLVFVIYSLMALSYLLMPRKRLQELEKDLQAIDLEIDLEQYEVPAFERRAEKVLRINQVQLQRYYDTNLRQNAWVFGIGVFCILIGIGVVAATLFLVVSVATEADERIIVAVVGGVGSILTNFIAAIYLRMHASATATLTEFHGRLIGTQNTFLGNLLASRIENEEKRTQTLADLALRVADGKKA